LKELRIRHGESLLKTTSMPVEEIAVASGFVTANAFIRRFKQCFGVSPGVFRDRIRRQKQNRRPI
jgi:AraC family transcriptional regulator of arabinose operon